MHREEKAQTINSVTNDVTSGLSEVIVSTLSWQCRLQKYNVSAGAFQQDTDRHKKHALLSGVEATAVVLLLVDTQTGAIVYSKCFFHSSSCLLYIQSRTAEALGLHCHTYKADHNDSNPDGNSLRPCVLFPLLFDSHTQHS